MAASDPILKTIFITRWWSTRGILRAEAHTFPPACVAFVKSSKGATIRLLPKQFRTTLTAAREQVRALASARRTRLQKSLRLATKALARLGDPPHLYAKKRA